MKRRARLRGLVFPCRGVEAHLSLQVDGGCDAIVATVVLDMDAGEVIGGRSGWSPCTARGQELIALDGDGAGGGDHAMLLPEEGEFHPEGVRVDRRTVGAHVLQPAVRGLLGVSEDRVTEMVVFRLSVAARANARMIAAKSTWWKWASTALLCGVLLAAAASVTYSGG